MECKWKADALCFQQKWNRNFHCLLLYSTTIEFPLKSKRVRTVFMHPFILQRSKWSSLHGVTFEGGKICLGKFSHFLKRGWCRFREQALDLKVCVEDCHQNGGYFVYQASVVMSVLDRCFAPHTVWEGSDRFGAWFHDPNRLRNISQLCFDEC